MCTVHIILDQDDVSTFAIKTIVIILPETPTVI